VVPIADGVDLFSRFEEGLLQEIFRVSIRADPPSDECKKGWPLVGEPDEELVRERPRDRDGGVRHDGRVRAGSRHGLAIFTFAHSQPRGTLATWATRAGGPAAALAGLQRLRYTLA